MRLLQGIAVFVIVFSIAYGIAYGVLTLHPEWVR
jgi:hypothetical protein